MSEPVHIIRFGLIKCEIHVRRTRVGECFNVTLSRLFRDGAVWRESKQLNRDDLLVASKILDLAHTWIYTEYRPAANEKEGKE
jgi:hypothetical protein